jgi:hypothetical protein
MRNLVQQLRSCSIEEVSELDFVQKRLRQYANEEERMLRVIRDAAYFIEDDKKKDVVVIDLTSYQRRPHLIKNLAFLVYPEEPATNPWKLILPDVTNQPKRSPELYNIYEDPKELSNRAGEFPEIVTGLRKQIESWWTK